MAELLLELFGEEIPARMQARAADDLRRLVVDRLAAAQLQHSRADVFVTPRRLTLVVDGLPAAQPDVAEERRGPRVGAPDQAVQGFLKAAGIASLEECEQRDTGKGVFWFAMIRKAGRPTAAVLPELLREAALELPWPKSQRFPAAPFRWVRPLTRVLCLFDGKVLPLELGAVPTGDVASGHRFLAPADFAVRDFADYAEKLRAAYVVLDPAERRSKIAADLALAAKAAGLVLKDDPGLLDEVTGLVEFPVVLAGSIDRRFMDVPPEVLTTSMRAHQKYFACLDGNGKLASNFLVVANNLTADGGKIIVAGNERVLRARLSDAQFFWDQDRKARLESRVEKLGERIFHAKLGSVLDKVRRIAALAEVLAPHIPGANAALAQRAALLAKADLSAGMVGEFPELQGVMGRYYALHDGEPIEIADAVAEHYSPLGPNDRCPTAPTSVVVALADKIDTLVGFFGIREWPTGSKDPFALRRAALGVIRLIIENKLRLGLRQIVLAACDIVNKQGVVKLAAGDAIGRPFAGVNPRATTKDLLAFFADRLKVHLREQGVRHDLIAAVLAPRPAASPPLPRAGEGRVRGNAGEDSAAPAQAQSSPHPDPLPHAGEGAESSAQAGGVEAMDGEVEDDLVRLLARVAALKEFLDSEDGANLLVAYRRASNIVRIEEKKDGAAYDGEPDPTLLQQEEESAVAERLSEVRRLSDAALQQEEFGVAMQALAKLRRPVDEFFSAVTVNCEDARLRANRLRLLSRIRATLGRVADFSQIEG